MSCQNGDDFPFKSKSPEPTEFCQSWTLYSLGTGLNLVNCSNLLFVPCLKRGAFQFIFIDLRSFFWLTRSLDVWHVRNVCLVFEAVTRRGISIQMETRGLCDKNKPEGDFYLWFLVYHQRLVSLKGLWMVIFVFRTIWWHFLLFECW